MAVEATAGDDVLVDDVYGPVEKFVGEPSPPLSVTSPSPSGPSVFASPAPAPATSVQPLVGVFSESVKRAAGSSFTPVNAKRQKVVASASQKENVRPSPSSGGKKT